MRSLLAQTFEDWEWIVVLNQGARWRPPVEDPRSACGRSRRPRGVGAAKRYACSCAWGVPRRARSRRRAALGRAELIVDAFDAHPEAGLVFSKFAQINEDGSRDHTQVRRAQRLGLRGGKSTAAGARNVTPWRLPAQRQLHLVRPEPRSGFSSIESTSSTGGYDATRDVLDDQDLMCRMYQLTEFHLIDECLYLQRMHKTQHATREPRSMPGSRGRPSSSTTAMSSPMHSRGLNARTDVLSFGPTRASRPAIWRGRYRSDEYRHRR